jgi:hypothetical protein
MTPFMYVCCLLADSTLTVSAEVDAHARQRLCFNNISIIIE